MSNGKLEETGKDTESKDENLRRRRDAGGADGTELKRSKREDGERGERAEGSAE